MKNKILVVILATSKNMNRIDAIYQTWFKDIKPPHKVVILGDLALYNKFGADKVWLCANGDNDKYEYLTRKMLIAFRMALAYQNWDFLYKCDDDTFLDFKNLKTFLSDKNPKEALYIGNGIFNPFLYAQGGAGYVITKMTLLKSWYMLENNLSKSRSEDRTVGKTMIESEIKLKKSELFGKRNEKEEGIAAIIDNNNISAHRVSPEYMIKIFNQRNNKIKNSFKPIQFQTGQIETQKEKSIAEIFDFYKTDKNTVHSYGLIYESILSPFRHSSKYVLELGIKEGASLRSWKEYFSKATIVGVDINKKSMINEEGRITTLCLDRKNKKELCEHAQDNNIKYDIIIDDADHNIEPQLLSLVYLWPYLKEGGLYIIEDVQSEDHFKYFDIIPNVTSINLKSVKGRGDDLMVIIQKGKSAQ